MTIVTEGFDLSKNVFVVHGVDASGKPALVRPSVACEKLLELIASLPSCLIGMEACSGARHWAREFAKLGHSVRLMAPQFVAPYRLSGNRGKNDAADTASAKASWSSAPPPIAQQGRARHPEPAGCAVRGGLAALPGRPNAAACPWPNSPG